MRSHLRTLCKTQIAPDQVLVDLSKLGKVGSSSAPLSATGQCHGFVTLPATCNEGVCTNAYLLRAQRQMEMVRALPLLLRSPAAGSPEFAKLLGAAVRREKPSHRKFIYARASA